jgi:B12-binding domain/radical SAM domain protein
MFATDIVFLHPPSLFDFRKRAVLLGPISDVIPSTPIFEMYPIGFVSLCHHLEKAGFSTRIINMANKMLMSPRYDPAREIARLKPKAFAVDLHWLPHVQGSLALGELIKSIHPHRPIIYGGYSATYYSDELIRYPFVDYVIKGDSTEFPLVMLMRAIVNGGDYRRVPNLTFKDATGRIHTNEISHVPTEIDDITIDYGLPIKKVFRFLDFKGYVPFRSWPRYPMTAIFPYRGCRYDCISCGASKSAGERVFQRFQLAVKSPQKVAEELAQSARYFNAPSMLIGDILQNGQDYAYRLLDEIKRLQLRNQFVIEFFTPPPEDVIRRIQASIPRYNVEMSPESHDETIRHAFGRPFDNRQLEDAIASFVEKDCGRIDVFFMIGLPRQTYESVLETVDYCEYLLATYGKRKNLHPYIAPLAPFLDPGSTVRERPETYGYRLFARTLADHRQLMETAATWKDFLSYETKWMTRDEIVDSTYEAALRLNSHKRKHGLIQQRTADLLENRIYRARAQLQRIDDMTENGQRDSLAWHNLQDELRGALMSTLYHKEELNWPIGALRFNLPGILSRLLKRAS